MERPKEKKRTIFQNKIILVVFIVLSVLILASVTYGLYRVVRNYHDRTGISDSDNKSGGSSQKKQDSIDLVAYKGSVWAAKIPKGWKTNETESGIDIYDSDDTMKTGVSSAVAIGWFGESDPDKFIDWVLGQIKASDIKFLSESSGAPVTDPNTGKVWNMKTKILTFTDKDGRAVKAKASAGVMNGYGQYIAMFSAFQTTPDKWDKWSKVLERVAQSITIVNYSKLGGMDKVRLPTAADLANDSSPLMDAWEYRQNSQDKSSHEWSDAMLGRESGLVSPSTGSTYEMPLNDYDPTVGGYHNPDNYSEILHDPYAD